MEVFLGILVPISFFLIAGATIGTVILTRHKERMTMLEKGLSPEDIKSLYEKTGSPRFSPLSSLKWGMIFVAIGVAVLLGLYIRETYYVDEGVFPGLIALFGGLGLITFYLLAKKRIQQ